MDSVERGQSFTVTRDGHRIGHLVPLEHRHTFLPREEFTSGWHGPAADPDWLRADVDELIDNDVHDPYDR